METQFQVGQAIGNYAVSRILGAGAMGEVYLALHPQIGRRVAIKVLGRHLAHMPGFADRFMAEAQALCRIKHPNVVDVYDFGQTSDGLPYYLMDYLEGHELADVMEQRGSMALDEVNIYAQQICAGLQAAHDAGVIHRDLKPQNIFVLPQSPPAIKILDFGIAKLLNRPGNAAATATGVLMGSPATISPEQASGRVEQIGVGSDIYSLGVVLYWMLAGRPPFVDDVPAIVVAKHITEEPPPIEGFAPSVPAAVARLIAQCLAKEPERRPASASELGEAFSRAQPATGPTARLRKRLTEELKELFKRTTPAPLPVVPAVVVPLESPAPASSRVPNNTTLRGATGEVVSLEARWEDNARIPRRRFLPWITVLGLCCAVALGAWQLVRASAVNTAEQSRATLPAPTKASVVKELALSERPATTAVAVQKTHPTVAPVPEPEPQREAVARRTRRRAKRRAASSTAPPSRPRRPAVARSVPIPARAQTAADEGGPGAASSSPARAGAPSAAASPITNYHKQYMRAMEAFTMGARVEAIRLARVAHRTDPSEPGAPKLLGILYLERDKYQLSAIYFERYLKLNPGAADAASIRRILRQTRTGGSTR